MRWAVPGDDSLHYLPLIDELARRTARRSELSELEIEDFASFVQLRFVESNFEQIRLFQGRSSGIHSYLQLVITRMFLYYNDGRTPTGR